MEVDGVPPSPASLYRLLKGAVVSLTRLFTHLSVSALIKDDITLSTAICEITYKQSRHNQRLGDFIQQVSKRNKSGEHLPVMSVSNRFGFIQQSEQFESRAVASEDTSHYKIVSYNDFAYNPARINVGSIARFKHRSQGIVSPMYVCFRTNNDVLPEYLEHFFDTQHFTLEMDKRLEGSVRMCLSFEGLCNVPICVPSIEEQTHIAKLMNNISSMIEIEDSILQKNNLIKRHLLAELLI